MLYIS